MNVRLKRTNGFTLPRVSDFVEKIQESKSEKDIISVCSRITESLETSYFTYGLMQHDDFHNIKIKLMGDHKSPWVNEYLENSYELCDPRIHSCIKSISPIFWDTDKASLSRLKPKAQEMMERARDHQLSTGVCSSVGSHNLEAGFGVGLTLGEHPNKQKAHLEQIAPYVSYLGGFVDQAIVKLYGLSEYEYDGFLTTREKDCLSWAADGITASQIALKLHISESTVKFHFKNTKKKLKARNTSQAIAIAILKGHIKPYMVGD